MTAIISFWYLHSPAWTYASFLRSIRSLEGSVGVSDMAHNLTKPLFQDYTRQGRIIGVLIRLARICLGSLLYVGVAILYVLAYAFWLLFPLICLVSLLGSLAGPSYTLGEL